MESIKLILILSVLCTFSYATFPRNISSPSPKRDILTENPQRRLEENGDNYIILHFNYLCEYTKGFKNEYRNDVSLIKYMFKEYAPTDELLLAKGDKIEIHFA